MLHFLIRRIFFGILVMWAVATGVFVLYFVAPHNVARTLAGRQATAQTIGLIEHRLGLDRPPEEQGDVQVVEVLAAGQEVAHDRQARRGRQPLRARGELRADVAIGNDSPSRVTMIPFSRVHVLRSAPRF